MLCCVVLEIYLVTVFELKIEYASLAAIWLNESRFMKFSCQNCLHWICSLYLLLVYIRLPISDEAITIMFQSL